MTLISENEAEPIHSAILRKEAWTQDAVKLLRMDADKRMKEGPWTVTADRPKAPEDLDIHEYYSEAPYWWPDPANPNGPYIRRDGHTRTDRFMSNRNALGAMCDAVFSLGTAAFLLDNAAYGARAAKVINTWFVNPKTRMDPNLDHAQAIPGTNSGRAEGVLDGRGLIRAIQGMEFLAATGTWDAKDQAAVHKWFEDYMRWLNHAKNADDERTSGNNHATWFVAQASAVASFTSDAASEQAMFAFYRDRVLKQFKKDGSAPREEARTRSLSYSAFNLEAASNVCRIAQVQGVDLWSAQVNGVGLGTVIDYLTPFFNDPKKWTKDQIIDFDASGAYSLAFAGIGLRKPEYVAEYRRLEKSENAWGAFVDLIAGRWEASGHPIKRQPAR